MLFEHVEHGKRCLFIRTARHALFDKPLYAVTRFVRHFACRKARKIEHAERVVYAYGEVLQRIEDCAVEVEYI